MCHDGVFEGIHVHSIDFFELFIGPLLAVEQLQHHNAGHMLLKIRIDARNGHAYPPVGIAHCLAEEHSGDEDQRQRCEGNQRQRPLLAQHDGHNAGEHKHVFHNRDHASRK